MRVLLSHSSRVLCISLNVSWGLSLNVSRLSLPGYHNLITRRRDDGPRGGVGLFIKQTVNYKIREDLSVFIPHVFESVFVETINKTEKNTLVGIIYRPNTEPRADIDILTSNLEYIMDTANHENKHCVIMGNMNVDLIKFETHTKTSEYLDGIFAHGFLPVITKPTRVGSSSATLIDHMYINHITSSYHSGIIINDVADHFGTFCIFVTNWGCVRGQYHTTMNKHSVQFFFFFLLAQSQQ